VPALIKRLSAPKTDPHRPEIIAALAATKDERAAPLLKRLLLDADDRVVTRAFEALGSEKATLALIDYLHNNNRNVQERAAQVTTLAEVQLFAPAKEELTAALKPLLGSVDTRAAALAALDSVRSSRATLAVVIPTGAVQPAVEAELAKLQGTWESASYEATGMPKNSRTVTLVFQGPRMTVKGGGEEQVLCELNVDKHPKWLDLVVREGTFVVSTTKGIYRLDGNTLTICHGGPLRPTKFEIRKEQWHADSLIVLKRKR
jgi:uncharacterized protein (TIGR03067 family)